MLVVGSVVTLALSLGAAALNRRNEDRLLRQRAREIQLLLRSAVTSAQVPLTSSSLVVDATDGRADAFRSLMAPETGTKGPYVSASLWRRDVDPPAPLIVVGRAPSLVDESPAAVRAFLDRAKAGALSIHDLLRANPRRVGYATRSPSGRFVVYTEQQFPPNRKAAIAKDNAFSDLGYALYLGKRPDDAQLIASSTGHGITGRTASTAAPFGDDSVLIVVTANKQLGGTLLQVLPWILAAFGVGLTAGSTLLAERLIRGRESAESLASTLDVVATENARLYNEQRSVARTLQHTLLPAALPRVGLDLAARYVAGDVDVEIGGDWYDVVPLEDGRFLFVIGDVSGRGIPAATVMASLRYAVRAYAAQADSPEVILTKLAGLLNVTADGHFATVLCGRIDLRSRTIEAANAGHLNPLLLTGGAATYLSIPVGVPIGAAERPAYSLFRAELPMAGTLLLYTDGLVERRGESLDIGFSRLAEAAEKEADAPVETLLARVVNELIPGGANDDTALLGLRWNL